MKARPLFCGMVLVAALAISGCGIEKVHVQRMKPAEVNLSSYKTVAVAGIAGPGGLAFGDELTQAIFDSGRFQVVDRQNLQRVLGEQGLGTTGLVDPASAAQVGKLTGSQAIIVGQVTRRDYKENTTRSDATCYNRNNQQYACTNFQTTGTWAFNVGLKVIDTASGQIVATKALSGGDQKAVQNTDALPALNWDRESVFDGIQRNEISEFMRVIAPFSVTTDVQLFTTSDLPELGRGASLAKAGDWTEAIEQFKEACARADQSSDVSAKVRARCHYDLAVAYGYSGHYDDADREIKQAIGLRSEDVFLQESSRIRGFKSDDERLRQQGAQ